MKVGDICYILINNRTVEEVIIKNVNGNLYTLKFVNEDKTIRLTKHRLFTTKEDALITIPKSKTNDSNEIRGNRPPMLH